MQLRLYPKGVEITPGKAEELIRKYGDLPSRDPAVERVKQIERGERRLWLWGWPGAMIEAAAQ
jgi:hypothetical protein